MLCHCNEQAVLRHKLTTRSVTLGTSKTNKCSPTFHYWCSLNRHQTSLSQTAVRVDIFLLAYIIISDYPVISTQLNVVLRNRAQGVQQTVSKSYCRFRLSTFPYQKLQIRSPLEVYCLNYFLLCIQVMCYVLYRVKKKVRPNFLFYEYTCYEGWFPC